MVEELRSSLKDDKQSDRWEWGGEIYSLICEGMENEIACDIC